MPDGNKIKEILVTGGKRLALKGVEPVAMSAAEKAGNSAAAAADTGVYYSRLAVVGLLALTMLLTSFFTVGLAGLSVLIVLALTSAASDEAQMVVFWLVGLTFVIGPPIVLMIIWIFTKGVGPKIGANIKATILQNVAAIFR